jgi:hypothetical protein
MNKPEHRSERQPGTSVRKMSGTSIGTSATGIDRHQQIRDRRQVNRNIDRRQPGTSIVTSRLRQASRRCRRRLARASATRAPAPPTSPMLRNAPHSPEPTQARRRHGDEHEPQQKPTGQAHQIPLHPGRVRPRSSRTRGGSLSENRPWLYHARRVRSIMELGRLLETVRAAEAGPDRNSALRECSIRTSPT